MIRALSLFLMFCLFSGPLLAQDDGAIQKRMNLAKQLHDLRPVEPQVNAAIDQVAQAQPQNEREAFRTAMTRALDLQAIKEKSVQAMTEIYTLEELEAMVEYYSKPEAISAAQKEQAYAARIYPEIIKMLDKALLKVRTGQP